MTDIAADLAIETAAKIAVRSFLRKHPWHAHSYDEMLSDARLGAVKAALSYDPDTGIQRGWWLWRRARGEMLDGLRNRDPRSREQYDAGVEHLPTQMPPLPLESDFGEEMVVEDRSQCRVESWMVLEPVLRKLPERERIVLVACDGYGVPLGEIADRYKVTVSRISQIRKDARETVRAMIQDVG